MAAAKDVIVISGLIFILGMGLFIFHFSFSTMVDNIVTVPVVNSSAGSVTAFEGIKTLSDRFDYVIGGIFFALVMALVITGWFVSGNAIFMFVYFLVIIIAVAFSAVMSNTWETMSQMAVFGDTITHFPITNNLLIYLPFYTAVVGFIGLIAMFAKPYFATK